MDWWVYEPVGSPAGRSASRSVRQPEAQRADGYPNRRLNEPVGTTAGGSGSRWVRQPVGLRSGGGLLIRVTHRLTYRLTRLDKPAADHPFISIGSPIGIGSRSRRLITRPWPPIHPARGAAGWSPVHQVNWATAYT